jgi:quercetin dioxygenase-like cupin family protein
MPVIHAEKTAVTQVKEGVTRYLIHEQRLMTVVIDFNNGPWEVPDPPHSHVHEQTTYVAAGEIIFFCEGEPDARLKEGDMFCVPSGKLHTIQVLSTHVRLIDSFTPLRTDFLGV